MLPRISTLMKIERCHDFAMHPDGRAFVTGHPECMRVFSVEPERIVERLYLEGWFPSLRFDAGGNVLAAIKWGGQAGNHLLQAWLASDADAGIIRLAPLANIPFRASSRARIAHFRGAWQVAVEFFDGPVRIYDLLTCEEEAREGAGCRAADISKSARSNGQSWFFRWEDDCLRIFKN